LEDVAKAFDEHLILSCQNKDTAVIIKRLYCLGGLAAENFCGMFV
jgi:hypothetical protein